MTVRPSGIRVWQAHPVSRWFSVSRVDRTRLAHHEHSFSVCLVYFADLVVLLVPAALTFDLYQANVCVDSLYLQLE